MKNRFLEDVSEKKSSDFSCSESVLTPNEDISPLNDSPSLISKNELVKMKFDSNLNTPNLL